MPHVAATNVSSRLPVHRTIMFFHAWHVLQYLSYYAALVARFAAMLSATVTLILYASSLPTRHFSCLEDCLLLFPRYVTRLEVLKSVTAVLLSLIICYTAVLTTSFAAFSVLTAQIRF